MSHELPRLRLGLDFLPSPDPQHPGLYIRDPLRFSDAILLVPPELVACLACFDGEQTELDLRQDLVRATGDIQVGDLERHLVDALSDAGFLENEQFENMQRARIEEFATASVREPAHAGSAYPGDAEEAHAQLNEFMLDSPVAGANNLLGIAAPHVSPFGGADCYRDAYNALRPEHADRTFVILGTSHYGAPDVFGLTRKNFLTPLGEARTDVALVDELERNAPQAVRMEDYCHAIEHSIEFQVLFLQHIYGPDVKILPLLCGSFARSVYQGGAPEDNDHVKRFFGSLAEIGARMGDDLFWVLGIDMAHMGRRYGDSMIARADQGEMRGVEERDRRRIDSVNESDSGAFWDQVQQRQDDLKWCGASPIYTFLKAMPQARGNLERYQQWNIDEQSVVSFAAMTFRPAE